MRNLFVGAAMVAGMMFLLGVLPLFPILKVVVLLATILYAAYKSLPLDALGAQMQRSPLGALLAGMLMLVGSLTLSAFGMAATAVAMLSMSGMLSPDAQSLQTVIGIGAIGAFGVGIYAFGRYAMRTL